tara:strand:+ start:663 stop:2654 length:1992 start_codon:yes stop_codon:yes gene_type:complete
MDFNKAKQYLDNELTSYIGIYDDLITQKTQSELSEINLKFENFNQDIQNGTNDFNMYYNQKVSELKAHVISQRDAFQNAIDTSEQNFLNHRDKVTTETMHCLLSKIYSIRIILDKEDDFLSDPTLEGLCTLYSKIVEFKTILWVDDEARDIYLFSEVYKSIMQSEPPTLDRDNFIPIMQRLMITVVQKKVADKSQLLIQSGEMGILASYASYTTPPSVSQRSEWYLLKESFTSTDSLNNRFKTGQIIEDWDENSITAQAMNLLLNKYLEKLPYIEPTVEVCNSIFKWQPDQMKIDPILMSLNDYYNRDNFKTYVTRSAMSIFLRSNGDSNNGFLIDLQTTPDHIVQNYDHYYPHDSYLDFDNNLNLIIHTQNPKLEYQRALSSFQSITQWSVHLGLSHALVADEWNYSFCQNMSIEHPLASLVKPLTLGVSAGINLASIILINDLPFSIAGLVSNLTPSALRLLTKKDIKNVEEYFYYPTIKSLVPIETPIIKTLNLWWNVIDNLVENYIDLIYPTIDDVNADISVIAWLDKIEIQSDSLLEKMKKTIKMMFFNPVIHELFSNDQLAIDSLQLKMQSIVHKSSPNGLPSLYVQNKLTDVLIATSGSSPTFCDNIFGKITDTNLENIIIQFQNDLKNIGDIINKDSINYTPLLHPDLVECSICW